MPQTYPTPIGGAGLVLSFRLQNKTVLILGSGALAASRAFAALEADASVIILARGPVCEELSWRAEKGQLQIVDWDNLPSSSNHNDALDAFLDKIPIITLAIVTDTLSIGRSRNYGSAQEVYRVFRARNIPVNCTDIPDLCDFTFTSSHRFESHENGEKTSLQVGVTTNGRGCRLAARLRREIVSKLPKEVGAAVKKVGQMRDMAKDGCDKSIEEDTLEEVGVLTPNRPVPSRSNSEDAAESRSRRMKWVAQVSEYWPISKLASMSEEEMKKVLSDDNALSLANATSHSLSAESLHFNALPKIGQILLVGSGPGHPSLLTIATHTALTQLADLVLSDKLVPDAVLSLIPKHVEVRIARKFPGNAEGAQIEMMEAAIEAARRGLTVVRVRTPLLHLLSFHADNPVFKHSLSKVTLLYMDERAKRCFISVLMALSLWSYQE